MKSVEEWLRLYEESHRNPTNVQIHEVCVPVIFVSSLGLLAAVPVGRWMNLGILATALVLGFYARFSRTVLLQMSLVVAASWLLVAALGRLPWPLWGSCGSLWLAAWAAQFVGHRIEGVRPSFVTDLQFLLIGPLWVARRWSDALVPVRRRRR